MSKDIEEKLFETIFGHALETLANKLINTTNKEENQIIVNILTKLKINFKNEMILVIGLSNQVIYVLIDLKDAVDLIFDFNEETI